MRSIIIILGFIISFSCNIFIAYRTKATEKANRKKIDQLVQQTAIEKKDLVRTMIASYGPFLEARVNTLLHNIMRLDGRGIDVSNEFESDSTGFYIFQFNTNDCHVCIDHEMIRIKKLASDGKKVIVIVDNCDSSNLKSYARKYKFNEFYRLMDKGINEKLYHSEYPVLYHVSLNGKCERVMILNKKLQLFSSLFY